MLFRRALFVLVTLLASLASAQSIEWPTGPRPFGCPVWPVVQGHQPTDLGYPPGGGGMLVAWQGDAFEEWAGDHADSLPQLVPTGLRSDVERPSVVVLGAAGSCRPTVGLPTLFYSSDEHHFGVAERLTGCGADLAFSRVAFAAECELPAALRYTPFQHRIERLAARGAARDPLVERVAAHQPPFDGPSPSSSPTQRRYRISRATVGSEEWVEVEVHWRQNTSDARCPNEAFARGRFTRIGTGEWSAIEGISGEPLGVFHDGTRVMAIVTSEMTEGEICGGGSGCEIIATYQRTSEGRFVRAQRLPFQARGGNPVPMSSVLQQGDRFCGYE